jgi:hypothetical protein
MNGRRFEPPEPTIRYYDVHGDEFCASTRDLDMQLLYSRFLPHVPTSGCILDAGSGSGRVPKHSWSVDTQLFPLMLRK